MPSAARITPASMPWASEVRRSPSMSFSAPSRAAKYPQKSGYCGAPVPLGLPYVLLREIVLAAAPGALCRMNAHSTSPRQLNAAPSAHTAPQPAIV